MEADCLFCKIAAGDVPATIVHRDDRVLAFNDVNPQAPHHVLVISIEHLDSLNDVSKVDEQLVGHMFRIATKIADQLGIGDSGFRTVINTGADGGQSVSHLHVHMLGGRPMAWPPG